jgi:hypothetical protein
MGSVVSTFLVSLGVVAATIAAVLYVALGGPDQPATLRRQPSRGRRARSGPTGPVLTPAARTSPAPVKPDGIRPAGPPDQAEPSSGSQQGHPDRQPPGIEVPDEGQPVPPAPRLAAAPGPLTATGVGAVAAAPPVPVAHAGVARGPAVALPDSDPMRLRVLPAAPTTLWVRIRSGVALVVLVAVLGALLAMVVGAVLVGVAFLIRSATG